MRAELVTVTCACGRDFQPPARRIAAGRGKFCSNACRYANASRPSGLKYELKKVNPTSFKPGQKPWNADPEAVMPDPWNKGMQGLRLSLRTEFKPGNRPANWKGDDVGYFALHAWLRRAYGEPGACEHCGATERIQWANRTGQYLRDREDWLHLCPRCHRRYDIQNGLIGITAGRFGCAV